MRAWLARTADRLPGSRWLPEQVARIRASIHTKLLVAFLGIVVLLLALAAVGLGGLQSADQRAAELVSLERRIAAYRQLQHNATEQLYAVASAFLADDERQLDAALRRLQRFAYDFDRRVRVRRPRPGRHRAAARHRSRLLGAHSDRYACHRARASWRAR